jgi:FkbM family methyltransferase
VKSAIRDLLKAYIRKSPVNRGKRWLMESVGGLVSTSVPQRVTLPGGSAMLLNINEHVQRWIYYFGVYETDTATLFRELAKPGMTVVDVGANVGQYTLLAASSVGPTGYVHAFEADKRNFELLEANLAQNDYRSVKPNAVALSDTTGAVTLYSANSDNAGEHSLYQFDTTMRGQSIPAVTLDQYMESAFLGSTGHVDLIKIDVQGAEAKVLKGAEATLREHLPLVICEFEERWLQGMGSSTIELKAWLRSLGYAAYRYVGSRLVAVSDTEVHSLDNLLLVHESKRRTLQQSFAMA